MKKVIGSMIFVSALVISPWVIQAQTSTTTSNAQVQAMLMQIQALQAQIQAMQTAQLQVQTAQTNIQSTLSLIRNLRQGMSGEDVSALQAVLAADPTIYPEGSITGFYGRLTAEAVKKFQRKHGIETLGSVGPKTLRKLNEEFVKLGLRYESASSSHATSTRDNKDDDRNENKGKKLCAKVPPGHLIAPGWLKKNNGERPIIPECQTLPGGIEKKGDGWWKKGTTTTPTPPVATTTPDTIAPVISVIGISPATSTAVVSWTTNENSDSKVWFGTTTPVSTGSTANVSASTLISSHLISLSGLATSTTYYFVVGSTDASGNSATSSTNSFVTTSGL